MLLGSFIAQLITLISAPIITRLYTPSDFGILTLIWSYIVILSVIACLRLDQAVVIEDCDEYALHLVLLCIIITTTLVLALSIIMAWFPGIITKYIELNSNSHYLWFIPAGLMAFGINSTLTHWHTRQKDYFLIAFGRVAGALFSAFIKILLGILFFSSSFWLLSGNIIALVVPILLLLIIFLRKNLTQIIRISNKNYMLALLKKYKNFPTYYAATDIINSSSQNIPIILLGHFYSPAVIGFYGLSIAVLRRPIDIVSQSFSKVYLQKVAEEIHEGTDVRRNFIKSTLGLFIVGFFPFAALGLFGELLFVFLFGPKWATAGIYTQILSPWLFLGFVNPPATQIIIVKQKFKFNLKFNILNLGLRVLAIVVPSMLINKPIYSILAFSATGVFTNILYILYAFKHTR